MPRGERVSREAEPPDQGWAGRRAKLYPDEKYWMAKYCIEHDFLVRKGTTPADARDTAALILVNQGTTPNTVVKEALQWMRSHWASGPFDVTWYTPGGLVNATLHDFRTENPRLGIAAKLFLFPGHVNPDLQAVSGPEAVDFVERLDVSFAYGFLSAYAFDLDTGRTHFHYSEERSLQQACATLYAGHKFLFLDASKLKREGHAGYELSALLEQTKTVTLYTTTSADDEDIKNRFHTLCARVLPNEGETGGNPSRARTLRLRIVSHGAESVDSVDHFGYLTPSLEIS
jgi:hypothetical protein